MNTKISLVPNQSILIMNKNISVNCKFITLLVFIKFFIFNLLMILILKYNIGSKIMTFNKNDINTIKKAKEYPDYHGGELTQPEKEIFNSSLLTPNGILDVSLLQDTAELLNNCKKAEA